MADRPGEGWRLRAAELQERLGFTVSAGTDNDWLGAYAVVDFDSLDRLTARLSEGNDYKRLLWEEEQAHDRTAKEAEARLSDYEQALRRMVAIVDAYANGGTDALVALGKLGLEILALRAALSGSAGNEPGAEA